MLVCAPVSVCTTLELACLQPLASSHSLSILEGEEQQRLKKMKRRRIDGSFVRRTRRRERWIIVQRCVFIVPGSILVSGGGRT